jgi:prepilin-type N-terminal cleavage/methylation domain-containing protein
VQGVDVFKRLSQDRDRGFTLIELLVVIIIIGILAAVAIPVFLNQRQKATQASMKSDLRSVATNMETYFDTAATYPTFAASANPSIGGVTVRLSGQNRISSVATGAAAGTYCLVVTNTTVGTTYRYDSDRGGFIGTAACS